MVRFDGPTRKWFNPIGKVRAADRPEERVRLRMIEFLVREAGFSANRMSTEPPVPLQTGNRDGRADILCFDAFHRPLLLVECKGEHVKLNEQTAVQAARYNLQIRAPYVMLTNGIRDLLFAIQEDGSTRYVADFSSVFPLNADEGIRKMGFDMNEENAARGNNRDEGLKGDERPSRPLSYWTERGLWSDSASFADVTNAENSPIELFLTRFWTTDAFGDLVHYLPFQHGDLPGISGAFVRTRKIEYTHYAAGLFSDHTSRLWLLTATAEEAAAPVVRLSHIQHTDISFIINSLIIQALCNWGT